MMTTSLLEELGIAKMIIDIVASEFHVNGPGVGVLALSSQLDNSVAPPVPSITGFTFDGIEHGGLVATAEP